MSGDRKEWADILRATDGNEAATTYHEGTRQAVVATHKKKRVFFWFFVTVQIMFLFWTIAGISAGSDTSSCTGEFAEACKDGAEVGTFIGVALVFAGWMIVDIILGIMRLVYKFAR